KSRLTITGSDGKEFEYVPDGTLTYWSTSQKEVVDIQDAPLVFVGYGVEAPEHDWDDFKGQDVTGKVLLFLNDDPQVEGLFEGERRTYYGRWTYKFEQAMKRGAAGAIMIHTTPSASYGWSVIGHNGAEEGFALDISGSGYQVDLLGWIDEESSNRIAQSMGTDLEGLFEQGLSKDFQPVDTGYKVSAHIETAIRRIETKNVLGMLEGSDAELKEQVIVFSAHYDHLGVNLDLEGEDKIFNGAWDNAAGTAGILSLAEAFKALPESPRRSILFLACAAEESGSLGSRWFVANPPFERSRLVANFNIDMPQIFGITADLSAIGVETSSLGDTLREAAAQFSVEGNPVAVKGDPNPRAGSFYRSDQVNFAKAGIPALFINPGTEFVPPLDFDPDEYEDGHYHQVADEVDERWDLVGLERDLRIVFQAALSVANHDEMPRWKPGNEFEEEWEKLHGEGN
ncbi:MAG: M20/M25/M40 family metallo-hydrolase, partial [Acidobacteriota bacterium]